MDLNQLDKQTLFIHKHPSDSFCIENANADYIDVFAVVDLQLINEQHQYFKITAVKIDIDEMLDTATRQDIRHLIFVLLLGNAAKTKNRKYNIFNAKRLTFNGEHVSLNFGRDYPDQSYDRHLQLMIRYNSSIILWDEQAWIPLSDEMNPLIEGLINQGKTLKRPTVNE